MPESQIDRLEALLKSGDDRPVTIRPDGTIEETETMSEVPADSPLRKAFDAYKSTYAFERSKGWALQLAPMWQVGSPAGERQRRFEIMPFEQRESHVEGALWAAFMEGFEAALGVAGTKQSATEARIKHMVNRFLGWHLPKNFNPDAGISYTRPNYANPPELDPPLSGTNLFDATQAEALVRYMIEGLP